MYDLSNQTFTVLTFATVSELQDNGNDISVTLQSDAIVEVAAVKIKNGAIQGHYHSFIRIDGYDADKIEFDGGNYGAYGVRAEHLIGAPSLQEVISRLHSYIGGSTLLVQSVSPNLRNPFTAFKDRAKSYGYCFNNPTVELRNISAAARLQNAVQSSGVDLSETSVLQTANMLAEKREYWTDILADYDIYFDPENDDMSLRDRNDPLSWALMFAKLFIKLVDCSEEQDIIDDLEAEIETSPDGIDSDSEE